MLFLEDVMKYAVAAVIAVVLVGCTNEQWSPQSDSLADHMLDCNGQDATECAITHFVEVAGYEPRQQCQDVTRATTFDYVSHDVVSKKCGEDRLGCVTAYSPNGGIATIENNEDGRVPAVSAHEAMHILLRCETGNFDEAHLKTVWEGLRTN